MKDKKKDKKKDNHYVDNAVFNQEMIVWVKECEDAFDKGEQRPQVTNSIAEKIIKVCEGTAYRHNFNQYTYADEFALDAIENCVRYAHKFDYVNYKSPYSYFSRIAWQACVRRIQKEDKQWKTKLRYTMNIDISGVLNELQEHDNGVQYDNDYITFLQQLNDDKQIDLTVTEKKKRKRNIKVDNSLENSFETKD